MNPLSPKEREYGKEYRSKNKDLLKEKESKYYQENKDRLRENKKRWLENNKEKVAARRKELRDLNKEKYGKWSRAKYYKSQCNDKEYIKVAESLYQLKERLKEKEIDSNKQRPL